MANKLLKNVISFLNKRICSFCNCLSSQLNGGIMICSFDGYLTDILIIYQDLVFHCNSDLILIFTLCIVMHSDRGNSTLEYKKKQQVCINCLQLLYIFVFRKLSTFSCLTKPHFYGGKLNFTFFCFQFTHLITSQCV